MVLTVVCSFIPPYKLLAGASESLWSDPSRSHPLGLVQTQLILVIIAVLGSASQACVHANILKVCQDWLQVP